MTALAAATGLQARLSSLDGGLLWLYRLVWLAVASAAVLVHGLLLSEPGMQPAILALRLVKAGAIVTVATILFRRRQRDQVAALLSLAFLVWTITSSFDFAASDAILPILLDRLRFLLFALALLLFPDGEWRSAASRGVAVASSIVFVVGIAETLKLLPTHLFLPLAIACVLAAVGSLVTRFRTATTEALRQQLKWVALGLVSGIALILGARGGAALSAASPRLAALPILWEAMFQLGIIAIALGFLVSLLRYRLFDAEAAISRSASLAALTIALVAIFAGTEATIEWVGQQYFGMGIGNVSAAVAAAVAAVLLNPVHDRISRWAEQRFQRDLVLLKQQIPELLEDLAPSSSSRELGTAVLGRVCGAVHSMRAALLIEGVIIAVEGADRRNVRRPDLFPVRLPLRCSSGRIGGWLFLGPRPDGSLYGRDDLDAVNQILPMSRRVLLKTMSGEALRSERQRIERRLAAQIKGLQQRILALEVQSRSVPMS
jgi:hypothetical protein